MNDDESRLSFPTVTKPVDDPFGIEKAEFLTKTLKQLIEFVSIDLGIDDLLERVEERDYPELFRYLYEN